MIQFGRVTWKAGFEAGFETGPPADITAVFYNASGNQLDSIPRKVGTAARLFATSQPGIDHIYVSSSRPFAIAQLRRAG